MLTRCVMYEHFWILTMCDVCKNYLGAHVKNAPMDFGSMRRTGKGRNM